MGYSTSAPAMLLMQTLAGKGPSFWVLTGTDADTTVRLTGYITNAALLGMKKGDLVFYTLTNASPIANYIFNVSAINANGSADLSNSTAVTATNSD